jgi:hypothetical protein
MNLSTIITNIKERISVIPKDEPIFIYIGIGTSAGLKNNNGVLEPQNYHQYPPFLQDLKNKIVELNLFIVLIDPMQEQPPYSIADKGLDWVNNNDSNATAHTNTIKFTSAAPPPTASGIAVFTLLQSVYTDPYECYGDSINITEELRELNKYVMEENITLLYHDFTGRRNNLLAEYFDPEIKTHLNHVVYGMSARQDHGCYFDLSEPSSYFPWGLCPPTPVGKFCPGVCPAGVRAGATDGRTCLKLFNIYYYIVNDCLNRLAQDAQYYSAVDVNTMINTQIEQVISTIKSDLINHMLSLLRIIFRLIVGDEQRADINVEHCFNFISKIHREKFLNLYNDNNYIELYDKLIDYFSKDIDIVSKLKKHDLTGKEILLFIVSGDKPYEWYANIKHHF